MLSNLTKVDSYEEVRVANNQTREGEGNSNGDALCVSNCQKVDERKQLEMCVLLLLRLRLLLRLLLLLLQFFN